MQFRCASRMHFIKTGDTVEVKCKSKHCGAKSGVVVLHRFNLTTGKLIETKHYKDPAALFTERTDR